MTIECPCCGSSQEERASYREKNGLGETADKFKTCAYCGTAKCVMCDMGDDVECAACGNGEGD